jgi:hypothetical protein
MPGQWITIGAKEGSDGKKHGGSPVYIEDGHITKGHKSLEGKGIDSLSPKSRKPPPWYGKSTGWLSEKRGTPAWMPEPGKSSEPPPTEPEAPKIQQPPKAPQPARPSQPPQPAVPEGLPAGWGEPEPGSPLASPSGRQMIHNFERDLNRTKLPRKVKQEYRSLLHKAIRHMNQTAIDRMNAGIASTDFRRTVGGVTSAYKRLSRQTLKRGYRINGFYGARGLCLDHGRTPDDALGTYVHELTHAIDGPRFEISESAAWHEAWLDEIVRPKRISDYAATQPVEGLAEFGRMALNLKLGRQSIEENFPKCVKVLKEWGIW